MCLSYAAEVNFVYRHTEPELVCQVAKAGDVLSPALHEVKLANGASLEQLGVADKKEERNIMNPNASEPQPPGRIPAWLSAVYINQRRSPHRVQSRIDAAIACCSRNVILG